VGTPCWMVSGCGIVGREVLQHAHPTYAPKP
jgi:hypothetical protein